MHKIGKCTKEKRAGEEIFQKKKNCFEASLICLHGTGLTDLIHTHTSFLLSVSFMILSFPLHETSSLDENDYSLGNMFAVTHTNSACGAMPYMLDNFHLLAKSTQMFEPTMLCACQGIDIIIITRLDIVC